MKKIYNILMAAAIALGTFTSCEDVPMPFNNPLDYLEPDDEKTVIEPAGDGTKDSPFNVAGVLAYLEELGPDVESTKDIYVTGVVTAVKEQFSTQYGNAQFVISDNDEGTNQFTFYRGLYLGNKKYSNENDVNIQEEDVVVICGKIVNYRGSTPETVQNKAYVVSINGKGESVAPKPTGTPKGSGTLDDPYNATAANAYIATLASGAESDKDIYIKGKVSSIKEAFTTQYGNASFYLSDNGDDKEEQFYVFRTLYLGNKKYTEGDQIKAGDEIIVCGKVVNYMGNTPETAANKSYIYSLNGKTEGGGGGDTPSGDEQAKGSGTQTDPYNVKAIYDITAKLEAGQTSDNDYYFKGKICSVKYTFSAQYGTATFNISEDGKTGGTEFICYSVYTFGNQPWVEGNTQVAVGDEVVICGKITNYNGTLETASKKAYIYSLNGKTENTEGGGSPSEGETGGDADISAAFGDLDCTNLAAITLSDGTTLNFTQEGGKNPPIYHESTKIIRMYAQNAITITSSKNISKVVFTYDTYNGTAYKGNDAMYGEADSNKLTPSKDDTTVSFSNVNSKSLKVVNDFETNSGGTQFRISKIAITYAK
ncbi:MAG: hypothetical protein J6W24_01915 [Prevotella sp.]|nr:hypothetical protein [Prevotella sp.]